MLRIKNLAWKWRFDQIKYFYYSRFMDIINSLKIFETLSQETRLQVFRLLVQKGPEGLSAGAIANELGILHNTLSFHLNHLTNAGLVTSSRQGRYVYYFVNCELMRDFIAFMVQDCCSKQ